MSKSFSLIRTNPALTTNVKLVVTSAYKLFLESYRINQVLSQKRFSHFELKKEDYLFEQFYHFWKDIDSNLSFDTKNMEDWTTIYDNFKEQYDDTYFAGSAWCEDTDYTEEFEYTAPLWIKPGKAPKSFMVFRIDGPGLNTNGTTPNNFRTEYLDKFKIVTSFDLTEKTDIGQFLKRNFEHTDFPDAPMEINLENYTFSTWNGIDYEKGGFVQKSLFLDEEKSFNQPIFKTEEFFTENWQKLGVIFPNIVNFKFLYDDTPATPTSLRKWSINRYAGFYLDEIQEITQISPYRPFNLAKIADNKLESLTGLEVLSIPYLDKNRFIQDVSGRRYSYDPILNGWKTNITYYVEWKGQFYRLERVKNTDIGSFKADAIIGDWIYRVIADKNIEYPVDTTTTNPERIKLSKRVLINELSTMKEQIEIVPTLNFPNIIARNVIRKVNTNFTKLIRTYDEIAVDGEAVQVFTITFDSDLNNNLFSIPNFDEADLNYIEIEGKLHILKRYANNVPNVGGLYYLHTDWAVKMTTTRLEQWINNGNLTSDPQFYSAANIEKVDTSVGPKFYKIYRASFTDVQDFDFDRIETEWSKFEYDKEYEVSTTEEEKLYAPERRDLNVTLWQPRQITSANLSWELMKDYLRSDLITYQGWLEFDADKIDFEQALTAYTNYHMGNRNTDSQSDNVNYVTLGSLTYPSATKGSTPYYKQLPLTIKPTRVPILNLNNEEYPVSLLDRWQTDFDEEYKWVTGTGFIERKLPLKRKWYREEDYRYVFYVDGVEKIVDFRTATQPIDMKPGLVFDPNYPMATSISDLPKFVENRDPNKDNNYIPVSSEYITSEELWELRQNNLTPIWHKNQWVSKWNYMGSISHMDNPYRFNLDLNTAGIWNKTPYIETGMITPSRKANDLDWFYRFGTIEVEETLDYSLHLRESYFNIDKYLEGGYDYFNWILNSDQLGSNGLKLTKKFSEFVFGNKFAEAHTVFRGVKYYIHDVAGINYDQDELNAPVDPQVIIDNYDLKPNTKYNDYKFAIVFGRKLSTFNNTAGIRGDGDGDLGIDIYLNDIYKHILIHVYVEVDQPFFFENKTPLPNNPKQLPEDFDKAYYKQVNPQVELDIISKLASNEEDHYIKYGRSRGYNYKKKVTHNVETCWNEFLYKYDQDINNPNKFFILNNSQPLKVSARDITLFRFIAILNNFNYKPENGSGLRETKFIHIYDDATISIMTHEDTDFLLTTDMPTKFLIKENAYTVDVINAPQIDINNTVKNRIVLDDDPNAVQGTVEYTSTGARVGAMHDVNSWNGLPVARVFKYENPNDDRPHFELEDTRDPEIRRFSGPYMPSFKKVELFRPSNYYMLNNNPNAKPILSDANWKFYDENSDGLSTGAVLEKFGFIDELLFSKVNRGGNILKLPEIGERSVFPIVDEYGYDVQKRFLFQSNWDPFYFMESRRIEVPKNVYPGKAGYSIHFDGDKDYLIIKDHAKFNLVVKDNYADTLSKVDPTAPEFPAFKIKLEDVKATFNDKVKPSTVQFGLTAANNTKHVIRPLLEIAVLKPAEPLRFKLKYKTSSNISIIKEYNSANYTNRTTLQHHIANLTTLIGSEFDISSEVNSNESVHIGSSTVGNKYLILTRKVPVDNASGWTVDYNFTYELIRRDSSDSYFDNTDGTVNTNGEVYSYYGKHSSTNAEKQEVVFTTNRNSGRIRFILRSKNYGHKDINININAGWSNIVRFMKSPERIEKRIDAQLGDHYECDVTIDSGEYNLSRGSIRIAIKPKAVNNNTLSGSDSKWNFFIEPIYNVHIIKNNGIVKSNSSYDQFITSGTRNILPVLGEHLEQMTVEFWVKVDGWSKENETIMYKGKNLEPDWSWAIKRNGITDKISFVTRTFQYIDVDGNGTLENLEHVDILPSNVNIADGDWHHIAFVFDGTARSKTIYINGQLDARKTGEHLQKIKIKPVVANVETPIEEKDPSVFDWHLYLGADAAVADSNGNPTSENSLRNFKGNIDELRLWNYARTSSEINTNYRLTLEPSSFLDPTKALIGYWQFNEQTGADIKDKSSTLKTIRRTTTVEMKLENDGVNITEATLINNYQAEVVPHYSTSDILNADVAIRGITFEVSGADIIGKSDARYVAHIPPASTIRRTFQLPPEVFLPSLYVNRKPIFGRFFGPMVQANKILNDLDIHTKQRKGFLGRILDEIQDNRRLNPFSVLNKTGINSTNVSKVKLLIDTAKPINVVQKAVETVQKAVFQPIKNLFRRKK